MTITLAFDVYGTLIDPLGIAETLGTYVGEQALAFTNERFGANLSAAACDRLMGKYLELPAYPDARPGLERLQARGDRRFAFSNGRPDDLERLLVHSGLDTLLDGIVSVQDVASYKT